MSILQNGTVSPRHLVSWTTTGVVQDAGSSATPGVSSLGLFGNGGTPFSITNSAVPGAPVGIYSQLNAGVSSTAAYINVDTFGTTALPLDFNINGSTVFSVTASGPTFGTPVPVNSGGTGLSATPTNGQLLIGNGTGYSLNTLTAGTGVSITNAAGTITIANNSAASVSSVAQTFTGGLISVSGSPITTSGTLALTVAGTSGGIPYFNSGTSWATSAALAANALVIGGGAGAAPSTTTTGTGVIAALGSAVSGSGGIALTTNPIFTTPTLGVATATSVNGLTINTTTGTLALANGSTLATSGAFNTTLTATAATNVTLPTTGTLATTANTVASFSAGSTGLTPSTATTGAITLGGTLGPTYGGTGVNNGSSTLTLAGSVTHAGAYPVTITATGTTSVTLPTTGNMLSSVTAVAAITGTPSSSTFIRGDGTWATPSGGGNVSSSGTPSNGQIAQWTGVSTIQGLATTGSGNAVLANGPALSAPTFSTSATVTAGTNAQGQGALTSDYNVITTTAANPSGVTLPTATTGRIVWVFNRGTNPVNVYPASGAAIDALGTNAAITLPVNAWLEFNAASTTLWYSSTLHQPTIYGTITFAAGP